MRRFSLHQVDSFTDKLFCGNPAAVVFDAEELSEQEMKAIANEMNLSETAFVFPSKNADFRLRFFTPPGDEIKFCGHATLGALCAIAKEERFGCIPPMKKLTVETNAGILLMQVDFSKGSMPLFSFDLPKIDLVPAPCSLGDLIEALHLDPELIDRSKPLMLEKTNNYLYFSVGSLEKLGELKIDFAAASAFAQKERYIIFCALTSETFEQGHHLHARGFAPLVGVPEDPFTGSMQGGLIAYALQNKMVDPSLDKLVIEQGDFLGRPGQVEVEIFSRQPLGVRLNCRAKHVFSTTLNLP